MNKKIIIFIIGLILLALCLILFLTKNKKEIKTNEVETNTTINTSSDNIDWSNYKTYDVNLDSSYEINSDGVYTFTGNISDGSIKVNTEGNVNIILNNVTIKNTSGPAIYVENAKNVYIELNGENIIEVNTTEDLDGAIYSKSDLFLEGNGKISIKSNLDGIVSKDDLTIYDGIYNIEVSDDGIRGKDSITIDGGIFNITATGKCLKTTNEEEKGEITINAGEFNLNGEDGINAISTLIISSGEFKIKTSDDGLHADGMIEINGGDIDIESTEGIEATYIKINDGNINIKASDDGINASNKSDKYSVNVEINGGDITINMGQGDTDAIDSNGNIYINGGTLNISANSPFDYDGEAKYQGGKMIINGEETNEITNQFGGGMMGGNMPPDERFNNMQGGNPRERNQ